MLVTTQAALGAGARSISSEDFSNRAVQRARASAQSRAERKPGWIKRRAVVVPDAGGTVVGRSDRRWRAGTTTPSGAGRYPAFFMSAVCRVAVPLLELRQRVHGFRGLLTVGLAIPSWL